jgi:hypothetical protein
MQHFDLTVGDFFIVRRVAISLLLKRDVYSSPFNDYDTKFQLADREVIVEEYAFIRRKTARVYWRRKFIHAFLAATAEWMVKAVDHDSCALIPGAKDLTP